ncbi:MAG: hypothetical protein M3Y42_02905 [Actinomycetota bacterium]|nr:hypothetical protein [Actinomycetota bacterium]MDQ2955897.1 hypothetical protein [Actinomycetota bacterium]
MTQYTVTLSLLPPTMAALTGSGFVLYALRATRSSDLAGRPLVWRSQSDYAPTTVISWLDGYVAYTSSSPIVPGQPVLAGFSVAVTPGQVLQVIKGGGGTVHSGGPAGTVSLSNTTTSEFTCGIGGGATGDQQPAFCAFPLYGLNLQVLTPLQVVLLMFSTQQLAPGTVYTGGSAESADQASPLNASTPGLLVDLSGQSGRGVGYDIDAGWSWDGGSWAQQLPAGTDLVPYLIQRPS